MGLVAAVAGREHGRAAHHVLEHTPDGELRARRLLVEVVRGDRADERTEGRHELIELGEGVHRFSKGSGGSAGTQQSGLSVAAR